jgi:hypothetical protein
MVTDLHDAPTFNVCKLTVTFLAHGRVKKVYKDSPPGQFSSPKSCFLDFDQLLVGHSNTPQEPPHSFSLMLIQLITAKMQFKMTAALAVAVFSFFVDQVQGQGAYLESIRHSANWEEHNLKGETRSAEMTVNAPKMGPFIMSFNGSNFTEMITFVEKNKVKMPFVISNLAPKKGKGEAMCILAGASNLKQVAVSALSERTLMECYMFHKTPLLYGKLLLPSPYPDDRVANPA